MSKADRNETRRRAAIERAYKRAALLILGTSFLSLTMLVAFKW